MNKLKKGDLVVMHTCIEASVPEYHGKVWTCRTDQYSAKDGSEVVFLEGFSGYFAAKYLQLVKTEVNMHPMALEFASQMSIELKANEHKGDWRNWRDTKEMISELEWHKAKLLFALEDDNADLVREYLADCGNILMFIGNARNIYNRSENEPCKKEQS